MLGDDPGAGDVVQPPQVRKKEPCQAFGLGMFQDRISRSRSRRAARIASFSALVIRGFRERSLYGYGNEATRRSPGALCRRRLFYV